MMLIIHIHVYVYTQSLLLITHTIAIYKILFKVLQSSLLVSNTTKIQFKVVSFMMVMNYRLVETWKESREFYISLLYNKVVLHLNKI